ncbi:rod shape-determining protein MreC [Rickettsiales endosymbiont of Peranema trichophorum]|uniref:rod shape-determining protein MreC n=1 Tax=Rickettsiales endosymbiont of Peranema trichophorum TaxID=2486577 RepID=UPI001023E66A|nr:rod shape-determining protein MreC [Rickettsiales endosymbiont of Peranema trichophorum]RZI47341.1 rod shape-determining protein MreC [Rickettsiales endosymbiont of Peranema trichophorum]
MTKPGFDSQTRFGAFLSIFNELQNFCFVVVVLFALIVLNTDNIIATTVNPRVRNLAWSFYSAVHQPIESIHNGINVMNKYVQLIEDNNRLEQENLVLRQQLRISDLQASHASSLEKLLNVVKSQKQKFYTAKVVLKIFNAYDVSLVVNVGAMNGIEENMLVFSEDGLIGKVTDVFENSARIMTIADPKSRIPIVFKRSGEISIASGTGHIDGKLDTLYTRDSSKVIEFEEAVSSGVGGIFEPGIVLGTARRNGDAIHIMTTMNYHALNYVIISSI